MKKVFFKNKVFHGCLIAYLVILICCNIYIGLNYKTNGPAILPISIQAILLYLIFTRSASAKIVLQIWICVFILGAQGLIILGSLMKGLDGIKLNAFLANVFQFIIGLILLEYTRKTVIVAFPVPITENKQNDSSDFNEDITEKI